MSPIAHGSPEELVGADGEELGEWIGGDDGFYGRYVEQVEWEPRLRFRQARIKYDRNGKYVSHTFTPWVEASHEEYVAIMGSTPKESV